MQTNRPLQIEYSPPNNPQLEQSILSTCLYDPDDIFFDSLQPNDFYRTAHQKIFKACLILKDKDTKIDAGAVANELSKAEELSNIGGADYISRLIDSPPVIDNNYAISQLLGFSRLRKCIEIGNALSKRSYSGTPDNVDSVIDYAHEQILKLSHGRQQQWTHIKDISLQCIERAEELSEQGGLTGIPSGYVDLDDCTCGFQDTDLILLAGRPRMGKTAFALNCIKNSSEKNFKAAVFSLEMAKIQIGNRFLSVMSGINSIKFRNGRFSREDWQNLVDAAGKLSKYGIWVDDSPYATHNDLVKRLRTLKRSEGIDIAWIDYLGFIDGDKSEKRYMEVQTISRAFKAAAKELEMPIVLICQLSRECEKRSDKRPILSDLRESGALEQDADVILFIYRDEVYNKDENNPNRGVAEIDVAKQRNGPEETIRLAWRERTTKFENLAPERYP